MNEVKLYNILITRILSDTDALIENLKGKTSSFISPYLQKLLLKIENNEGN